MKKLNQSSAIMYTFTFHDKSEFQRFREAFLRVCKIEQRVVAEFAANEESLEASFSGNMDTLCLLWHVSGAFTERGFLSNYKTILSHVN